MTISLRADPSGTSGTIVVNGVDRVTINSNGSVKGSPAAKEYSNLKVSSTGLNANVSITADELVLSSDDQSYTAVRSVNVTASTAASGAGGMDSGSTGASTWYSVWVISNGTQVAGLLSLSSTSPVMPAGYTHKTRVGWIRTDSTANKFPLAFTQVNTSVTYKVTSGSNLTGLPVMGSGVQGSGAAGATAFTWAALSTSTFFPSTAARARVVARVSVAASIALAPNNAYGGDGNSTNPPFFCVRGTSQSTFFSTYPVDVPLETNAVYAWSDGASNSFLALGWEDSL